jgi:hypothetical protein
LNIFFFFLVSSGIVRPQSFQRPPIQKIVVVATPKVTTTTAMHKTESTPIPIATMVTTTGEFYTKEH